MGTARQRQFEPLEGHQWSSVHSASPYCVGTVGRAYRPQPSAACSPAGRPQSSAYSSSKSLFSLGSSSTADDTDGAGGIFRTLGAASAFSSHKPLFSFRPTALLMKILRVRLCPSLTN